MFIRGGVGDHSGALPQDHKLGYVLRKSSPNGWRYLKTRRSQGPDHDGSVDQCTLQFCTRCERPASGRNLKTAWGLGALVSGYPLTSAPKPHATFRFRPLAGRSRLVQNWNVHWSTGIETYQDLLVPILELCPTGIPNYSCLRQAVRGLDEVFELSKGSIPDDLFYLNSCGRMKLMCQHVLSSVWVTARSLKVSDRRRNTPKSGQNRSESLCAGLWAPCRVFWD